MEESPSREADSSSPFQEIPCVVWNRNIYYSIHKNSPRVLILSHINSFHVPRPIYLSLILILSFHIRPQTFQIVSFRQVSEPYPVCMIWEDQKHGYFFCYK
jgi:hypothetical protein